MCISITWSVLSVYLLSDLCFCCPIWFVFSGLSYKPPRQEVTYLGWGIIYASQNAKICHVWEVFFLPYLDSGVKGVKKVSVERNGPNEMPLVKTESCVWFLTGLCDSKKLSSSRWRAFSFTEKVALLLSATPNWHIMLNKEWNKKERHEN